MSETFEPLNGRVLVRRLETEEKTKLAGGMTLPDNAKQKSQRGVIVAIDYGQTETVESVDGKNLVTLFAGRYRPGDEVLFGKYAGNELEINGETLIVMLAQELYGVFRKEDSHAGTTRVV